MTEIAPGLALVVADCLDALRELDAESIDAVVTDPPYLIGFMGKEFDEQGGAHLSPTAAQRWHEAWATEALRVLKPGGHALVFGGTRTYHRLACGLEDAGFEIRDCLAWLFGSGFPKSRNVGCRCGDQETEYDVRAPGVRNGDVSTAVGVGERAEVLLEGVPEQGSPADGPVSAERESGSEERGVEGRRHAMEEGGELPADQVRPGARVGATDGPEGRLRHGAPPADGGEDRSAPDADGGRPSSEPRPSGQPDREPRALADEQGPQALGGWPLCPRCGLPRAGLGTALKPAFEPIVVARKPLIGTVAGNVLAHGVGGLNVDACRIGFASDADQVAAFPGGRVTSHGSGSLAEVEAAQSALGRWPANVLLGHSPDCVLVGTREVASDGHYPAARSVSGGLTTGRFVGQDGLEERSTRGETVEVWDCVPDCPVRLLDGQTGELAAGNHPAVRNGREPERVYSGGPWSGTEGDRRPTDRGGASRFFYVAKVSRAERNAGLDGFDPRPLHWSSGDANPGSFQAEGTDKTARNNHPTVKPVALMRWLIRLVTPPGGLVLDPFAGSGSTGCAAALEGARFLGIERDLDYAKIAEARIRFWAEHGDKALQVVAGREASERTREAVAASGQLDLLGFDLLGGGE